MILPTLRFPTHSDLNVPQIYFDQLTTIARHHNVVRNHLPPISNIDSINNEINHIIILQEIDQG